MGLIATLRFRSNKKSLQLVKNKTRQIQISALVSIDLNEKGRQLPAGQSVFVNFWSTAPHSLEIQPPEIRTKTGELL